MVTLTRAEAGRRLAVGLGTLVKDPPVVIALSPGGVRVASEIARAFEAPLDVIAVLRLEVPGRSHSTFGAVADGSAIVLGERARALGLPEGYVENLVALARDEVERVARAWRAGMPAVRVDGRTVVLVDDGLSEAVLITAAASALQTQGVRRVVYAAPFATSELCRAIEPYCAEPLLLFAADASARAMICDPQFQQTTRIDVGTMIRRSRAEVVTVGG
jgi:predicted phosphoribosyltransferase